VWPGQQSSFDGVPFSRYCAPRARRSLLDNFEWQMRMTKRFGIVFVDVADGAKRYIKDSGRFLAQLFGTAPALAPAAAPVLAPAPAAAARDGARAPAAAAPLAQAPSTSAA